jgi:hypothetical protein
MAREDFPDLRPRSSREDRTRRVQVNEADKAGLVAGRKIVCEEFGNEGLLACGLTVTLPPGNLRYVQYGMDANQGLTGPSSPSLDFHGAHFG